jgi:hypothetical protein
MTETMMPPKPASPVNTHSYMTPSASVAKSQKSIIVLVVALTALVLIVGYQQMQISRLSSELGVVSGDVRSGETRGRLEALDAKLQEVNTRLTYLDSKIVSTDQKAQAALDRIKVNEQKADWFGNLLRGLGWK